MNPIGTRPVFQFLISVLLVSLTGCVSNPYGSYGRNPVRSQPGIQLTPHEVLGPIEGDGAAELARLAAEGGAAARLRRAFILAQTGSPAEAISVVNQILFGSHPPSPGVDGYAYFVRSLAHDALQDGERAAHDRDRAHELALDGSLRERIRPEGSGAPSTPAPMVATAGQRMLRSAWNARAANLRNMDPMGRVFRVTVHHSAMLARGQSAQVAATAIQAIQREHMGQRGYGDIGYHYLIDRAGRIWIGRDARFQGAHADKENNVGNLGICLLGNFVASPEGQLPTEAQIAALTGLLREITLRHRIPASQILTHREMRATSCPGESLQRVVDNMRHNWRSILAAGDTASTTNSAARTPAARAPAGGD